MRSIGFGVSMIERQKTIAINLHRIELKYGLIAEQIGVYVT